MKWVPSTVDFTKDPYLAAKREMASSLRAHAKALESTRAPAGEKPAVAEPVEFVSQLTCTTVLGLSKRRFLELLRRDDAPTVTRTGKMRLVRVDEMRTFLQRLGAKLDERQADETDGAGELLRELGYAPVRGRR